MKMLFAFLLLLLGCATKPSEKDTASLSRTWMITAFDTFSRESLIQHKAMINLENHKDTYTSFNCNRISFTTDIKKGQGIAFKDPGQTEMYCSPEQMLMEQAFMKYAPMMDGFILGERHTIRFTSKGKTLIEAVAADFD